LVGALSKLPAIARAASEFPEPAKCFLPIIKSATSEKFVPLYSSVFRVTYDPPYPPGVFPPKNIPASTEIPAPVPV
jgi:hypothetical protein